MGEYLFSTFDPVTAKEWRERIMTDLKGREYEQALTWESPEGIRVNPFYNSEDLQALLEKYGDVLHTQTRKAEGNDWKVVTVVSVQDIDQANSEALEALMKGAGGICFDLDGSPFHPDTVRQLINGIQLEAAPVTLVNFKGAPDLSNLTGVNANLAVLPDVLLCKLRSGSFQEADFWNNAWPEIKNGVLREEAFTVDGYIFKDAGAHIVQELAYSLAVANEYLNSKAAGATARFRVGLSGNYFFEIAKLRALRRLWAVLSARHDREGMGLHIESRSSVINKSLLDQHTNMLRNTAECMAGAIGGADSIVLNSHEVLGSYTSESRRWARNVSLILKHEAYLDRVSDPAEGSYFIETITSELCEAAWELFKDIESRGGFIQSYLSGHIKAEISESLKAQMNDLAIRKTTLIGVNDYPKESDRISAIEEDLSDGQELAPVRLSAKFEAIRLAAQKFGERSGTTPSACLITAGRPAIRKARVNYASNFLGCAGIFCVEPEGDMDFDTLASWIRRSKHGAAVICSDDESWPELLKAFQDKIDIPIILAGDPSGLPEELSLLPHHAIYLGCDVLKTLQAIQSDLFS